MLKDKVVAIYLIEMLLFLITGLYMAVNGI